MVKMWVGNSTVIHDGLKGNFKTDGILSAKTKKALPCGAETSAVYLGGTLQVTFLRHLAVKNWNGLITVSGDLPLHPIQVVVQFPHVGKDLLGWQGFDNVEYFLNLGLEVQQVPLCRCAPS